MSSTNIFQKVVDIHDQVMGMLRSMKVPPYPAHYKKYFDQLFLQIADEELKKSQEEAEHKVLSSSKDDVSRYLDIAQRSVMSFVEAHSDIASVAQVQREYLDNAPTNVLDRCITFIEGLHVLNKNMSDELDKAQNKVTELSSELHEVLSTLSIDPMTKVGNNAAFIDRMQLIMEMGETKKLSMVLMMVNIDNFKYINSEHGHQAGDNILYYIAQTIKSMIRDGDKIYRYGGDQFALILARCDDKQAMNIGEKIRSKIEQGKLLYMGQSIFVTISIGATNHRQGDTLKQIIDRAAEGLYCAKKSSKNCTVVHDW